MTTDVFNVTKDSTLILPDLVLNLNQGVWSTGKVFALLAILIFTSIKIKNVSSMDVNFTISTSVRNANRDLLLKMADV